VNDLEKRRIGVLVLNNVKTAPGGSMGKGMKGLERNFTESSETGKRGGGEIMKHSRCSLYEPAKRNKIHPGGGGRKGELAEGGEGKIEMKSNKIRVDRAFQTKGGDGNNVAVDVLQI